MTDYILTADNPVLHASRFAFIHEQAMPEQAWSETAFAEQCAQPGVFAKLHRVDAHELDGFLLARLVADECEILTFAVLPERQRQGIATHLLMGMFDYAMQQGAKACFLDVAEDNIPAMQLYKRWGFLEITRRTKYYQGRIDAVIMRKDVKADS